jgi:hypothetical protein
VSHGLAEIVINGVVLRSESDVEPDHRQYDPRGSQGMIPSGVEFM